MLYDLKNPLQYKSFEARTKKLLSECKDIVELTVRRPGRTLQQNKYLHLLLGYVASITGNTQEYIKTEYFKLHVNPDIFVYHVQDPILGNVRRLRSTKELDTEQMSLSIERFRNFAANRQAKATATA